VGVVLKGTTGEGGGLGARRQVDGKSWLAEAKGGRLKERLGATGALATFWFQSPLGRFAGGWRGYRYYTSNEIRPVRFRVCSSSKRPPFPSVEWRRKEGRKDKKKKGRNKRRWWWTGGICCG